jgi:hypothetical protein
MIKVYLVQKSVTFKHEIRDSWSETILVDSFSADCRINSRIRRIRDFKGEEKTSMFSLYLASLIMDSTATLDTDWLVNIDGTDWPIISIKRNQDFSTVFYEVFL